MTQIDEKAYEKASSHNTYSLRQFVEGYEAAKAPRTISRDEFDLLHKEFSHAFDQSPVFKWSNGMLAALATLGITVGD